MTTLHNTGIVVSLATGEFKGEYGKAFGTNLRFRTGNGDAPVLRLLWTKDGNAWRIISYDVEQP